MTINFARDARDLREELVRIRRDLHMHPELGLELPRTQERVLAELDGLPLEITLGRGCTSVGAVLRGGAVPAGEDRPTVLLRADMDALPVPEATGLDFTSTIPDRMHACGHDMHTAMLLGAARLLASHRDALAGDVVFMFQPGEELLAGAPLMIEEGILDLAGKRADAAFALHVFSAGGQLGAFGSRPGPMLSAADALFVKVLGRGGHGSKPHMAADPVPVMAEMIGALQTLQTRQIDPHDPIVLSVGMVKAGEAVNVIPEVAQFGASIRTFSAAAREHLQAAIPQLLRGIAHAHGVDVDIEYLIGGRVLVNDDRHTRFAASRVTEVFGEERFVKLTQPLGGSEDFAEVLARVPGTFITLDASQGENCDENHSPRAIFDESVMTDGAALYADLAATRLAAGSELPAEFGEPVEREAAASVA